jgi:uncharacterized protein YuzE
MQFQYDVQADAMAVQFTKGEGRVLTEEVAPGVYLDFDAKGKLVAIEVLHASRHVPRAVLEAHPYPIEYLTLAEAGEESGLSPATLRRQINNGRIAAVKRGRDWLIDGLSLLNYLESRAPSGRPPIKRKPARVTRKGTSKRARPA